MVASCALMQPKLATSPGEAADGLAVQQALLSRAAELTASRGDASARAARMLHGRCLILLGDSTMEETVDDLSILLWNLHGAALEQFASRASRMPSAADYTSADNTTSLLNMSSFGARHTGTISFQTNQRKMWFTHAPSDVVVLHRFIGHPELFGNARGIGTLNVLKVRSELLAMADAACGARPRVLWLQSGYHDVANPLLRGTLRDPHAPGGLATSYARIASKALDWSERLAPTRLWLSRHDFSVKSAYEKAEGTEHYNAVRFFEDWIQGHALPPRRNWKYVDHREAWSCAVRDERALPLHVGPIQRGWYNSSWCCLHLSSLRTWAAVVATAESLKQHEQTVAVAAREQTLTRSRNHTRGGQADPVLNGCGPKRMYECARS